MKKRVLALLCALAVAGTGPKVFPPLQAEAAETGTTYYISSLRGDNSKDGTSENTAWETLDKLSGLALKPGDQILLEKGSVFNGYIHLVDVHGTEENPIRLGSYGEGTEKPVINADGQGVWYQDYGARLDNTGHQYRGYVSSAILLYDVDFVEVSGLEITNQSDDFTFFEGAESSVNPTASENPYNSTAGRMDRTGVAGVAKDGGTMQHVYLEDLYIHDVDGNIQDKHMDNGGIQMNALAPEDEAATGVARYDDIKIRNCYVRDVSRAGICVGYTYQWARFQGSQITDETAQTYGHTNVVIENNYVKDIGNDAIVTLYAHRPLIQSNVSDGCGADLKKYSGFHQPLCAAVWPWKCKDAVLQYNEVFDTVNNQDGQSWDIDWADGTVYQYNYSHNNGGGCIMFCGAEAYRGVFRYNISYNDLNGLISLAGNPKGMIYNNVFYLDGDLSTVVFRNSGSYTGIAELKNNIFYNDSANKNQDKTIKQANRSYSNNLFYGYADVPTDNGNLTGDPLFVNAEKSVAKTADGAVHERSAFEGYQVQDNSPAVNAGTAVEGSPKYDFFGNEVGMIPDIGVYESPVAEEGLSLRGISLTVDGDVIKNVPKSMTVAELKADLVCGQGITLSVLKGNAAAQEDAAVTSDMTVKLVRGAESKVYTIQVAKEYLEYEPDAAMKASASAGSYQPNNNTEGNADLALDGDLSTMWHTDWNGCDQEDVWIMLDLGESRPVAMVKYVPRQSGGENGIFTEYKVEVRNSDTEAWKQVDAGTWAGDTATKYAAFDQVNARYVKLTGLKTMSKNQQADGSWLIFGTAAEVRVGYEAPEE